MSDERMRQLTELAQLVTAQVVDGLQNSVRCCPNCTFWIDNAEQCRNEKNCPQGPARPPATVIAWGCPLFIPAIPV